MVVWQTEPKKKGRGVSGATRVDQTVSISALMKVLVTDLGLLVLSGDGFGGRFDQANSVKPMGGVAVDPTLVDKLEREGVEIEVAAAPLSGAGDQVCLCQYAQVIHHCHAAHVEMCGEFANGKAGAIAQVIEYRAAGFLGEGLENRIHIFISKHEITLLHVGSESGPALRGSKNSVGGVEFTCGRQRENLIASLGHAD